MYAFSTFTESIMAETTQKTTISYKSTSIQNAGIWFIFYQWFCMATASCYYFAIFFCCDYKTLLSQILRFMMIYNDRTFTVNI